MTRYAKGFGQGARGAIRISLSPGLSPAVRTRPRRWHPYRGAVLGRGLFREAFDQLVGGPGGGGVVGDVDMHKFSAVVLKNQEPEEQAKGERGDHEEVDGDNLADMCPQEGAPRRGRPRRGAPHVLGNGELRDLMPRKRSSAWIRR